MRTSILLAGGGLLLGALVLLVAPADAADAAELHAHRPSCRCSQSRPQYPPPPPAPYPLLPPRHDADPVPAPRTPPRPPQSHYHKLDVILPRRKPCREDCPTIYAPLCVTGCRTPMRTFDNRCLAAAYACHHNQMLIIVHSGPCQCRRNSRRK